MSRVIVVGAGAAGMMAAVAASRRGHQVLVLEKNEKAGKKIYITGKGRCNVTNACGAEEFLEQVVSNPRFLYSAFYGFDNHAVRAFFEERGCPLKVERGNRVFPVSDHSSDIIRTLTAEMERSGARVRLRSTVRRLLFTEEGARAGGRICGVELVSGEKLAADAVILCCGGLSYPATGSTGDGYRLARSAGHSLTPCVPSLVPFCIREEWCRRLQGLALKNVAASLYLEGREIWNGFGELLFTHFGVSGPLILSASSYYQSSLLSPKKKKGKGDRGKGDTEKENTGQDKKTGDGGSVGTEEAGADRTALLKLDLKPALSREQLDRRLLRDFDENKNRRFKNALGGLFPASLIPVMIELSEISPEKQVNEITREERRRLLECTKEMKLTVTGTGGFEEAIITKGGVRVKEINPSTMESRLMPGLYMAGEMLDVDALTGGFNLQIAWSTGWLAGSSVM